jgi:uncharacterized Rmd1/YagE family protein
MIVWQLDLQLPMQSVPITTEVVSYKNTHRLKWIFVVVVAINVFLYLINLS